MTLRRHLLIVLLAFAAALGGAVLGCRIMMPHAAAGTDLHALLHADMALDPGQQARLEALEARFAVTRRALEAQQRADNAALAAAIAAEHGDGPQVAAAVDRSHRTMGALQKATLAHVFAMRRLLRPDQAATFDRAVMRALTDPS